MSSKGLGINGLKIDGTKDSNALDAIEKIKAAMEACPKTLNRSGKMGT